MSFTYGGINTDDLEGVKVTPITYPNMGGLQLDTVPTPGRDGRFYGGSRMTTSQLPFRVTISGEDQQQADLRRLAFMRMLDPSTGARSLRLDNTANWHYPQAVVAQQIEWEKHADRSKVMYDGEVMFETNFDAAMRQIEPSTVSGSGLVEFIADMGSTVSYPTVIFESGGDIRVRVNEFIVDLYDTPPDTYGVVNWDEYKFYTAEPDLEKSLLYVWEGTPHASESIKLEGGIEVNRNTVPNPQAENDTFGWSGAGLQSTSSSHDRLMFGGYTDNIFYVRSTSNYPEMRSDILPIEAGQFLGVHTLLATEHNQPIRVQIHWTNDGSTFAYSSQGWRTDAAFYSGKLLIGAYQAPTDADGYRIQIQVDNTETQANPRIWVREVMGAIADTEQDALAQIEHYFDGDSVGHIVPGERISSLVNAMSHFERPAIYPGQRVEVEVTPIGSNTATPVIIYPNHRRL